MTMSTGDMGIWKCRYVRDKQVDIWSCGICKFGAWGHEMMDSGNQEPESLQSNFSISERFSRINCGIEPTPPIVTETKLSQRFVQMKNTRFFFLVIVVSVESTPFLI